MSSPPISAEKVALVRKLLAEGLSRDETAKRAGVGEGTVSKIKGGAEMRNAEPKPEETQSEEISGDSWKISLPKTRICTLDELVAHCKIDLGIWEVERFICNKWEVGAKVGEKLVAEPLFQVKAFLKKKKAVAHARAEIELLRKEALKYSPKFTGFKPRKPAGSGVAAEFFNTDHHLDAAIWDEETDGDPWNMKLSEEAWKDAFSTQMSRVDGYKPDMAVIPMGGDQQNADKKDGTTTKGTPQVMAARYQQGYELSKKLSRFSIDQALQKYGRVHVPIVPGNHDQLTAWHLGDHLATWYRNCPGVTIDNTPTLRKWWEFGFVMLMWEHGDKGKLPDYGEIMASKRPEMWGRTKWRETHTGHLHMQRVFEGMGWIARICPSLRPSCSWGVDNHHEGSIRASEAFVWSKTEGLIGQATYSILRKSEA